MTTMPNANPTAVLTGDNLVIKCAGVNKTFKDFWLRPRVKAVQDVTLEVRKGEVFGLLGPNGSGKSTTIKLILGLLNPTSGRIAVFGKRPEDVATKELIGYLPEESYLYRFLNARETLDYYGRLFHLPRHVRQKRIDMLLEMVGLDAAQHRPVGEYSKGMQRRIGLAQALINQPQLLILDEPTTGMDPIGSRQIKDLLARLKDRGITILLCSHLLADVEDVCDRVTIMFGGRVVEEGTIDDLLVQRDSTVLESSQLDDETIQQIEAVMARRGKHIERVTSRRQTLEKKFLDLVERERLKGSATSGAKSGGEIAGFLLDDDGRSGRLPDEAADVLDELTRPAAPVAPARAAPPPPRREEADLDAQVLSQLSGKAPPPAQSPAVGAASAEPEADLSVLAGLVVSSPTPPVKPAAPAPPIKPSAPAPSIEPPPAANAKPLSAAPAPAPVVAKPAPPAEPVKKEKPPEPPPKPLVSKESGESGLGLMQGLSADDEELNLPPIDPPKPTPPRATGKSSERPDESFLKAIDDADEEK
jgi:ABC-2 type transport system ATP-binding protein